MRKWEKGRPTKQHLEKRYFKVIRQVEAIILCLTQHENIKIRDDKIQIKIQNGQDIELMFGKPE